MLSNKLVRFTQFLQSEQRVSLSLLRKCSSKEQPPSSPSSKEIEVQKGGGREESGTLRDKLPREAVFYHPQCDMYVCWHPEVPFPYEMSKPIPLEAHGTDSHLKIQALEPVKEVFRKKNERLVLKELMKMTYTEQYRWRGKHEGKKMKIVKAQMNPLKQKKNREYL